MPGAQKKLRAKGPGDRPPRDVLLLLIGVAVSLEGFIVKQRLPLREGRGPQVACQSADSSLKRAGPPPQCGRRR
jgi:hypothetical protein